MAAKGDIMTRKRVTTYLNTFTHFTDRGGDHTSPSYKTTTGHTQ